MSRKLTDQEAAERAERKRKYAREYMRDKYRNDPVQKERMREAARLYREKNAEKVKANKLRYYAENRERFLQEMKDKYNKRSPYRLIAEQMLGRKLERGEHVHHIDCDHSNDVPENLHVMSASEHIKAHTTLNALAKGLMADGIIAYDRETKSYRRV